MYRHSVTIYDSQGNLLASVPDRVNLKSFGFSQYSGDSYLGGPVEATFTADGKYLWVSNYTMEGPGFNNPGCDACNGKNYDPGFVYKINTSGFEIEKAIQVGSVPKYLAISPDQKIMVVSNWSSGDISVIDLVAETEVRKIDVGAHPRGIAITSDSKYAYVTIMGSTKIAHVNLVDYSVDYLEKVGNSPRHLVLSEDDSTLFVSLNSGNCLLKYDVASGQKMYCSTNSGPRSMILSPDQKFIYVVNYFSDTFSKISADSMQVLEVVETGHHPIGITANWEDAEIWVACYEGKIEIFKDFQLEELLHPETFLFEQELEFFLNLFQPRGVPEGSNRVSQPQDDEEVVLSQSAEMVEIVPVDTAVVKPGPRAGNSSFSALDPSKGRVKSVVRNPAGCSYHVIVGSFSIPENAQDFSETVKGKGYTGEVLANSGSLTYVSAACFQTREEANQAIPEIYAGLKVKGWVLHRN